MFNFKLPRCFIFLLLFQLAKDCCPPFEDVNKYNIQRVFIIKIKTDHYYKILIHKSLGMRHDGKNKCDSGGYFIMESSTNIYNSDDLHNSFLFSKCSLETLNFTSRNLIDGV